MRHKEPIIEARTIFVMLIMLGLLSGTVTIIISIWELSWKGCACGIGVIGLSLAAAAFMIKEVD
jgi:hypothetical protein